MNQDHQALAVDAIDDDAADGAQHQARRRTAKTKNAEAQRGTGDLVGDPVKCNFLDEMTERGEQITRPKQGIVAVAKGAKDLNESGLLSWVGAVNGINYNSKLARAARKR